MSRLDEISGQYLEEQTKGNIYHKDDVYESGHPNATSDGDEFGKEAEGSKTDIGKRNLLLGKNGYGSSNSYGPGGEQ